MQHKHNLFLTQKLELGYQFQYDMAKDESKEPVSRSRCCRN